MAPGSQRSTASVGHGQSGTPPPHLSTHPALLQSESGAALVPMQTTSIHSRQASGSSLHSPNPAALNIPISFGHYTTNVSPAIDGNPESPGENGPAVSALVFSATMPPPPLVIIQASNGSKFFRSEDMTYIQLYIPPDIAEVTVTALGELGVVHFINLNYSKNAFQLPFVGEIRKFDEMMRSLRFLCAESEKVGLQIPKADTKAVLRTSVDELGLELQESEACIRKINESHIKIAKILFQLTEHHHVVSATTKFFDIQCNEACAPAILPSSPSGETHALLGKMFDIEAAVEHGLGPNEGYGNVSAGTHLSFIAGVIRAEKLAVFEKLLMRLLRGNLYFNSVNISSPIMDPTTEESIFKSVFIIFINGVEVVEKIKNLTSTMGGTIYAVSAKTTARREELQAIGSRIDDVTKILHSTKAAKVESLEKNFTLFNDWFYLLQKKKSVFQKMNYFCSDGKRKTLIADGWCPTESIPRIQRVLFEAKEIARSMVSSALNVVATTKIPPTYIKETAITSGFQRIIDAYGIAKYKEMNPAIYAAITFPFLFAVMFGDLGHGIILSLIAAFMCLRQRTMENICKSSDILTMLFGGRYIMLLMGLFSVYTGCIYNDVFSRMMSPFQSSWNTSSIGKAERLPIVYPFGIDWGWSLATNKLNFLNNFKMKMSVIFAVIQMSFAMFLALSNHIYFKNRINIFAEFIPQVIFMQSIFGYLVVLIIYKWCQVWGEIGSSNAPPGLLNTLIFMFLELGGTNNAFYSNQVAVQRTLLLLAFISVPWMLCLKPYLLWRENKKSPGYGTISHNSLDQSGGSVDSRGLSPLVLDERQGCSAPATPSSSQDAALTRNTNESGSHEHGGEVFDFGEIVTHQIIHTIEFCLGSVSNTASYLRLWALSLAHAQLSEVLWEMPMKVLLGLTGSVAFPFVASFLIFPLWLGGTFAVLLGMEGLSAFLHALRLHWVEFDSKFYEATGYLFEPFNFNNLE